MAWAEQAARSLTETFDDSFEAAGIAVAAAGIDIADADLAGTALHASPADTPADGRFEIGSVTKTMTATLLALLAAEGTLALDDEIGRWLPAGANGWITPRQLATHTSGLPRIAPNFRPAHADNFWAGFTPELAEEGLRQATVTPGAARVYSNFGYQLLGLVLERASGQDYATLVTDRLLGPLSMTCSGVGRAGGGIPLPGHAGGREVPHWDRPLPGAGGVEATIGDLARYAEACLRPPPTPLGTALRAAQEPQAPIEPGRAQALGWIVVDGQLRGHSGGTGGFSSCVITDGGQGRAIAVMISSRGYSDALARAARLALAGHDPREARQQPLGPEWEDRTREVVRALLDGRTAEVHARATPRFRGKMPLEDLDRAWSRRARVAGRAGEVLVSCQRRSGLVIADVTIAFARAPLIMRIAFLESGEIAGLRLLPQPEPAAQPEPGQPG
jgi:D-alanyl-D-alanine-carboxypeptidase/D-alanyl-D-alanine-endopeptidase